MKLPSILIDSDDGLVLVESDCMGSGGELDGVLGLEDVIEFLEL